MNKKIILPLLLQMICLLAAGVLSDDLWYAIAISLIGVIFNYLVSLGKSAGFCFGALYAVTNGILAFSSGVYATFVFMIFLQAPMAIYSYATWRKKQKETDDILKKMSPASSILLLVFMLILFGVMYAVLRWLGSTAVLADTIFFVFSVTACLLLAMRYKNAYLVTVWSGFGGTLLWGYQMITVGSGFSLAVFYLIVAVNSVIAIYRTYVLGGVSDKATVCT